MSIQPSADPWRDAVEQMLAITEQVASDDPRKSIHRLIDWYVSVALDPLVSSDARALVQRGREEVAPQPSAEPVAVVDKTIPSAEIQYTSAALDGLPHGTMLYTAPQPSAEYEEDFDICPNCVTPWKCNGPHITQPSAEPSAELVRAARDVVTIPRIVAEQALRYVETGDPHGRLRVINALRRALDAIPETGEARDAARWRTINAHWSEMSESMDHDGCPVRLVVTVDFTRPKAHPGDDLQDAIDAAMGDAPEAKGGGLTAPAEEAR